MKVSGQDKMWLCFYIRLKLEVRLDCFDFQHKYTFVVPVEFGEGKLDTNNKSLIIKNYILY